MIFGIGIDAIEVERIEKSIATYGDQFLNRIYSEYEVKYSMRRVHHGEHFAARFAAKEAFAKALGTGVRRGFVWREVSVAHEIGGRPYIQLSGAMAERAKKIVGENFRVHLSISHTKSIGEAIVVIERE